MLNRLRLLLVCLPLAVACSISSVAVAARVTVPADSGSGGINAVSQRDAPVLLLISLDGFRWDYLGHYPAPALERLAAGGVRAQSLQPVYPTLTFPNHYSLATGMYPAEHGIVANDFPGADGTSWYHYKKRASVQDGRWYRGEPIWVAAERAGLVSAAFFFVGSEAPVGGILPTHWRAYDVDVPAAARIDQALAWLALPLTERPHLVALYFEDVDVASHRYGPGSPESIAAIRDVDGHIGQLLAGLDELPVRDEVYVVVVSDHGQSRYAADSEPLVLSDFLDLADVTVVDAGTFAYLYLPRDDAARAADIVHRVNARWQHGRALLPGKAPAGWHLAPLPRIGDVIVQADPGHAVLSSRDKLSRLNRGAHGWAPEFRDMHGIFIARGPGLPAGVLVDTVEAVEVYPLLLDILGLPDRRRQRHPSRLAPLLSGDAHTAQQQ